MGPDIIKDFHHLVDEVSDEFTGPFKADGQGPNPVDITINGLKNVINQNPAILKDFKAINENKSRKTILQKLPCEYDSVQFRTLELLFSSEVTKLKNEIAKATTPKLMEIFQELVENKNQFLILIFLKSLPARSVKDFFQYHNFKLETPFLLIAQSGNKDAILIALNQSKATNSINIKYEVYGSTALHYAAKSGNKDAIEAILSYIPKNERAVFIKQQNSMGDTPLHLATEKGDEKVINALLNGLSKEEQKAYGEIRNSFEQKAWHLAAMHGNTKAFSALPKTFNSQDSGFQSVLNHIKKTGNEKTLFMALSIIPIKDKQFIECLKLVAWLEIIDTIESPIEKYHIPVTPASEALFAEVLAERKAFSLVKNWLSSSLKKENADSYLEEIASLPYLVSLMVRHHKEKVDQMVQNDMIPMEVRLEAYHMALFTTAKENPEEFQKVLDAIPDNIKTAVLERKKSATGDTVLHLAAESGDIKIISAILSSTSNPGALIKQQNLWGETALHLAAQNGHKEVVSLILETIPGNEVDAYCSLKNKAGGTALMLAAENNKLATFLKILRASSSEEKKSFLLNQQDSSHNTSLDYALQKGMILERFNEIPELYAFKPLTSALKKLPEEEQTQLREFFTKLQSLDDFKKSASQWIRFFEQCAGKNHAFIPFLILMRSVNENKISLSEEDLSKIFNVLKQKEVGQPMIWNPLVKALNSILEGNLSTSKTLMNIFTIDNVKEIPVVTGVYMAMVGLKSIKEFEKANSTKEMKAVLLEVLSKSFGLGKIENYEEKYDKNINSMRMPEAIPLWIGGITQEFTKKFVQTAALYFSVIIEGQENFSKVRYDLDNNPHLAFIESQRPGLIQKWAQGSGKTNVADIINTMNISSEQVGMTAQDYCKHLLLEQHHLPLPEDNSKPLGQLKLYLEGKIEHKEALKILADSIKSCQLEIKKTKDPKQKEELEKNRDFLKLEHLLINFADPKRKLGYEEHTLKLLENISIFVNDLYPKEPFQKDLKDFLSTKPEKHPIEYYQKLTIEDTDNYQDLFLCGTEVKGSCQSITGQPRINIGLASYGLNGHHRVQAIKDETGKIVDRAFLTMKIEDDGKPTLYLEGCYPYPEEDALLNNVITAYAIQRAKDLGLPLYAEDPTPDGTDTAQLEVKESLIPYVYDDAKGGGQIWGLPLKHPRGKALYIP